MPFTGLISEEQRRKREQERNSQSLTAVPQFRCWLLWALETVPLTLWGGSAAALILNLFDKMKVQEATCVFSKCHNFLRSLHLPSRGATSALPCSEEERLLMRSLRLNSDLGGFKLFQKPINKPMILLSHSFAITVLTSRGNLTTTRQAREKTLGLMKGWICEESFPFLPSFLIIY